jgi:hypothetical protein
VGEYEHGSFATGSYVDEKTVTIAVSFMPVFFSFYIASWSERLWYHLILRGWIFVQMKQNYIFAQAQIHADVIFLQEKLFHS